MSLERLKAFLSRSAKRKPRGPSPKPQVIPVPTNSPSRPQGLSAPLAGNLLSSSSSLLSLVPLRLNPTATISNPSLTSISNPVVLASPTPPPQVLPSVTNSPPAPTAKTNPAFALALKAHMDTLSPKEQSDFIAADLTSPEVLLEKVQGLDEAHSQKSISRKCEKIGVFLEVLNKYLASLAIISGCDPQISSLVVGAVKLVVDLGIRFISFFNKLTDMMEHLTRHLGYLNAYAKTFEDSAELQKVLCDVYGDLLKFCLGVRKVFLDKSGNLSRWTSFRVFLRITWEPFENEFDAIRVRFDDRAQVVVRTVGSLESERIRLESELKDKTRAVKERRKLLLWLEELSGLNFDVYHNGVFEKWLPGTGDWLLESPEFKSWLDKKDSCLLWCHGTPGVGKSVLTSLVLEKISERYALDDHTGITFVYFNYQDQGAQKYYKVLADLIKQLCRKDKVLSDRLKEFYTKYYGGAEVPSHHALKAQFLEVSKTFHQVFVVMDALDECEDREHFLPFVMSLIQEFNFKIFVTSRREKDIATAFTKGNFPTIQVEATKINADIKAFVSSQITKRTREDNLCDINQMLRNKIEETLVSQANGMFLWVRYQLDNIYQQPSIQDIEHALSSLPEDMNETYLRILKKIDKQPQAIRDLARRALMWVLTAGRPLSPEELAVAVAIVPSCECYGDMKEYKPQTVIDACGNFLTVESNKVRPVHNTVKEFLTASQSATDVQSDRVFRYYRVFQSETHVRLAQCCLLYMLFINKVSISSYFFGEWLLKDRLLKNHVFYDYTSSFWDYHVRALDPMPDDIQYILGQFLFGGEKCLVVSFQLRTRAVYEEATPLGLCLAADMLHIFQMFQKFDKSILEEKKYKTALHHAAAGGSVSSIKQLLSLGYAVETLDDNGRQSLYWASEAGHAHAVNFLLEEGAEVNAQGGTYGNALQAAAIRGHEAVVQMLLEKGAEVNAEGGEYGNALQAAAHGGHEAVALMLLEAGAEVNAQGGEYGNAFQAAAQGGNEAVVQMLLEAGAEVNAQGGEYGNALQAAAHGGHEAVALMLLEAGAEVNAQGGEYGNALQAAAHGGHEAVALMLLKAGAEVNAQGGFYGNALQAAALGSHEVVAQMLLEAGAKANAQGGFYGNALQAAALGSHEAVALMLLEAGAKANAQGGYYGNALQAAAQGGHEAVVQMLLEAGAETDAQGGYYGNALQAAAQGGHEAVALMLLEAGAEANAQGGRYDNALQAAALEGHEAVVQMLIKQGALQCHIQKNPIQQSKESQ